MKPSPCCINHPLWSCGLRPFFLFAAIAALLLMLPWLGFLGHGLPLPAVPGGPFVWHAHELLFGFALAAMTGFLLTVVPSFAGGNDFAPRQVRRLALLWLAGRIAFWSSGGLGTTALVISALAHLALLGGLAWLAAPRLIRDPERQHLAFLWALAGFTVCVAGFYFDALSGQHPARWLHAALGVFMMLIVVAMSRISLRIVNHAIGEMGLTSVEYRARPPRRKLAIVCIGLYTAAEFIAPGTRLSGWLALAAAVALFNLMNDWHLGRVLFHRRVLMFYAVYLLMTAGFAVMGLSLLLGTNTFSGGQHLLTVGALGQAIYAVMSIAGRAHCGQPFETRAWMPVGAALLALAALVRALAAWPGMQPAPFWIVAGLLWIAAYGLFAWHMVPLFLAPRADGRFGCKGTAIP